MKLTEKKLRKLVRTEIRKSINEDFSEDQGIQGAADELKYQAGVHQAYDDLVSVLVRILPVSYQNEIAEEINNILDI